VAALYGLLVRLRLWCFRRGWLPTSRLPCRVISVGNLTVGGTGKTPIVILLAEWLLAQGRRVAILSRGYKRASANRHLLVSDGSRLLADPLEAGDEPFLMGQRCPRAIVAVGADRAALGGWVLARFPVDCMILDDGFQHRALHRDVDLVLLDATDATGLDAMLPAGRLREPLSGLARAHAVLITRAERKEDVEAVLGRLRTISGPLEDCIEVVFQPQTLLSVQGRGKRPLEWCRGKKIWLASGIGNSDSFHRSAASLGADIRGETTLQDHHCYRPADVGEIRAKAQAAGAEIVLTTEKDAVKLPSVLAQDDPWWALRVHPEVARGEERLRRLVLGESREAGA
jgi:tetraacyldisaccharide 4'-kinase